MSLIDPMDRDLPIWFHETARPRLPDYTDDVIRQATAIRQRPRWTFLERWLPVAVTLDRVPVAPLPWRTIGLLVALGLLVLTAVVAVGSRPRLPEPFGRAANGLVAYGWGGDIFTVDPGTGARRAIVSGPTYDHNPRFSLDGTHLVFLRDAGNYRSWLVIVDKDGHDSIVAAIDPPIEIDTDGISWSPDGRTIALVVNAPKPPSVYLVDAATGNATAPDIEHGFMEVYWRPPDGRQLMFYGGPEDDPGLFVLSVKDGAVERLPTPGGHHDELRPLGWTPDGSRFLFHDNGYSTHVVDATTGQDTIVPAGNGHLSNDGTRMVGLDGDGQVEWLCVALISGGPCDRLGGGSLVPSGGDHESLHWSPDDTRIITRPEDHGRSPSIVDSLGASLRQPSWIADGAESWQRLAP